MLGWLGKNIVLRLQALLEFIDDWLILMILKETWYLQECAICKAIINSPVSLRTISGKEMPLVNISKKIND